MPNNEYDCTTCKYSYYDDRWNTFLCNNLECKKWELWEPKEEEKENAK